MIDFDQALAALFQSEKSRYVLEEPMSRHTTFQIGGPADLYIAVKDIIALKDIIRTANTLGIRLLRSNPALRQYPYYNILYDICLHHHERWDGGGYPDGLTGRHIIPYVHVVALADAYDALRTARPYKPPLSHSEAVSMLCGGACGAFSPEMITCLQALPEGFFAACYGEARKVG